MLVYANHLSFHGTDAEEAIFRAIGAWLKEQIGRGLHPEQLRKEGEFEGTRGTARSSLRIYAAGEEEPRLYSWVLRLADTAVRGRQWIVEAGVKIYRGVLNLSCVVKTDEYSTLVASPVTASQPRLIRYVANNVRNAKDADFAAAVPGVGVKTVGETRDSYRSLLVEIERPDREGPLVLVSPTKEGGYLLSADALQEQLIGLAQVVQVCQSFNSYEMADVLGQPRSAWGGAVNILYTPTPIGFVRTRYFLADAIAGWGDNQQARASQVLAWVTSNTNIPHLREHVRPEGVMQLSLRRRINAAREKSQRMDASQLRMALEEASTQAAQQTKYFEDLVNENSELEANIAELQGHLEDTKDALRNKDYTIQALKDQLDRAGDGQTPAVDPGSLIDLICRTGSPSPADCIELIEQLYSDRCTVLATAKKSAEKVQGFIFGQDLLDLLKRLVTDYRDKLMVSGDSEARKVFGRDEYAATESETVKKNKAMRRQRTFEYDGRKVEMFSHVKIGRKDSGAMTIRVHFDWDADRKKIVIGYCGEHRDISSR